jgi:hypothetical protein
MAIRIHLLVLLLGTAVRAHAQAPGFDEYQVKAVFLYTFAKFVEWPPGTFANSNGHDPFGSMLDDIVQGKKIGDRAFTVRRLPDTQQASQCQILFIGAAEMRTRVLLQALKGDGILTVGETVDFTALGGIICFKLEGTHVRLQIALETGEHARLRISSKLLSLAEIVKGPP